MRTLARAMLEEIIRIWDAHSTGYMLGLTTGLKRQMMVGKIDNPILKSGLSLSYDLSSFYHDVIYTDWISDDKPIISYHVGKMPDIPDWKPNATYS